MLELKKVCAGYGAKIVLSEASVSFEKGRLISIVGANGCGKSTLLKASCGIIDSLGGEITVDGVGIDSMKRNELAKRIAYLAQGKGLPDMTVKQMVLHGRFPHLAYPRRYTERDKDIALTAMKKMGVDRFSDQAMRELSGGMRQNAYIAMALAQDTDYILLDEPTTYLDIVHQLELMRLLRGLASEGKGVVAVMHDLPLAFELSDEIAVMRNGTVVAQAPPEEIAGQKIIDEIFGVSLKYSKECKKYVYSY